MKKILITMACLGGLIAYSIISGERQYQRNLRG